MNSLRAPWEKGLAAKVLHLLKLGVGISWNALSSLQVLSVTVSNFWLASVFPHPGRTCVEPPPVTRWAWLTWALCATPREVAL